MNAFKIRRARMEDVSKVAPLFDAYRRFYQQEPNLELAKEFISARLNNGESIIFIAEDEQLNSAGFCQIYPSFCSVSAAPIYVLYDLFVAPETRKLGLGKMLLESAEAHAKAHDILRMDLTTAKTNFDAQSLYESLGWIKDDIFFAYNRTV